ncbi:hypothetical protein ACW5R3_06375 [Bizionia sp. KMM 8389]
MRQVLHYHFERRSENHLDWLINVIKSEKYFQADSIIRTNKKTKYYNKTLKSA